MGGAEVDSGLLTDDLQGSLIMLHSSVLMSATNAPLKALSPLGKTWVLDHKAQADFGL